ncbi:MAG: hypothetical protein ACFN0Y_04225 [Lactobacillus sp.]
MIKKIKLEDDVAKLGQAYVNNKDSDWDVLVNKAVKFYVAKHCSSQKMKRMRQDSNESPVNLGELFNNMSNTNMYRE